MILVKLSERENRVYKVDFTMSAKEGGGLPLKQTTKKEYKTLGHLFL